MNNTAILTIEKQNLKCYLNYPDELKRDMGQYFQSEVGRDLFATLVTLKEKGLSYSESNVVKYGSQINSEIDLDLLEMVEDVKIQKTELPIYEKELREAHVQGLIEDEVLKELAKKSSRKGEFDKEEITKLISQLRSHVSKLDTADNQKIFSSFEALERYEEALEERSRSADRYGSGDNHLNAVLYRHALLPGEISIVFGHSGSGKSTFVNNLVTKREGRRMPTLHIVTEMSFEATMDARIAIRTGANRSTFTHFDEEDTRNYDHAIQLVKSLKAKAKKNKFFRYINADSITLAEIEDEIKFAKEDMGLNHDSPFLVVIDLLTMVRDFNKGTQRANDYEDAMNEISGIAKRQYVHIMGVVQARRNDKKSFTSVDELEYFRPTLEQLKNSAALEERSRIVFGVHRPKHFALKYLPNDPEVAIMDDIMDVQILKQNSGAIGQILQYLFTPENNRLSPYFSEDLDDEDLYD